MPTIQYEFPGDAAYQSRLYPSASVISPNPPKNSMLPDNRPFKTTADVIEHYTLSSLRCDGIQITANTFQVIETQGRYGIRFEVDSKYEDDANLFAQTHVKFLDEEHAGQALKGVDLLKSLTNAWNPMEGYPVNTSEGDTPCKWSPFLPLGMAMINHRAVILLHYPPYIAMAGADYLHNKTLERWQRLLACNDISTDDHWLYDTFLDVNPIAAPGSGQSEYPNDFFPILMASAFFDADPDKPGGNYIRPMLDLLLNPPRTKGNSCTLPLLIGGSPSYDPQAAAWFRVRYKDKLPQATHVGKRAVWNCPPGPGIPKVDVLDAGEVSLFSTSAKTTPYMIINHLIAAAVTGCCTDDATKIPDHRQYAAQDLVAAAFLKEFMINPEISAAEAKKKACLRWFGNDEGVGAPLPTTADDRITLCAMVQSDGRYNLSWTDAVAISKHLDEEVRAGTADGCSCDIGPRHHPPRVGERNWKVDCPDSPGK